MFDGLQYYSGPLFSFDDGTGSRLFGNRSSDHENAVPVRWEGDHWRALSGPFQGGVTAFAAFDFGGSPQLHVVGSFLTIGGVEARGFARWDGVSWHAIPGGPDPRRTVCVYDDGSGPALYMGGNAGEGLTYTPLYKYDGTQITPVMGLSSTGIFQINEMTVFDDGTGPALYVAGYIPGGIARYDGHQWTTLGVGLNGTVPSFQHAMDVADDGRGPSLFMAGTIFQAGGGQCLNLAQWVGCPNCYANCDNSSHSPALNILDFICFLNKFAAYEPAANCNQDASLDVTDFLCFLNKFAAGCP
jgi:hypothetical protein